MSAKSRSASPRGRLLVGSSISTTRARVAIARQISTTCWAPIGSRPSRASGSMSPCPNSASTSRVTRRARSRVPEAAAPRLDAHQHVLGHRQVREERQLLVDERDPARARVARRARGVGLAVDVQRPAVRAQQARHDREQRALAGSVLAEQGMDLARLHLERGARQRDGGAEALVDAGDPEDRRHSPGARYWSSGGLMSVCISGASTLAGVTTETPVSMSFGTALALQVVDERRRPPARTCGTGSAGRSPGARPCASRPRRPGWRRSRRA